MSIALSYNIPRSVSPVVLVGGKDERAMIGELAGDDLAALAKIGIRMRFARNETLFSEGDEATYSYRVVRGAIRLCKHLADGRRQIADFILPGDYCGFLYLEQHRFTAEATGDLEVIAYPQRQVEALGENMPSMRRRLTKFLSGRLMNMQDHLIMVGRQTAKERVISFLMRLADNADAADGEAIGLPMKRQDMADYLGLTIETVSRVLTCLKRSRLITLPNLHQFAITDIERCRDLVEWGEEIWRPGSSKMMDIAEA
jgi:CRP-like cAMP-binding protein